ncbi:IclR family transcriptional regulator C-terminal domain-containing protein [Streptomyces sp. NPDC088557]|uniref:IclR family transcriptional regulator domain-containing protein n=1 Tax=Streptomyces sp. NPDC088557 TaxID=3365867 RepID=UPI003829186B
MSEHSEVFRSVEDVLATASSEVPGQRPDLAASRARLLAHAAGLPSAPGAETADEPSEPATGPVTDSHPGRHPLDADEALRRLDALCAAVVLSRTAGSSLAAFAEYAAADPGGALVFACVLHLAGDGEGATFWWQLAAGAEVDPAVHCLFLDHSRRGEYQDAAVWARRPGGADAPGALAGDPTRPPSPLLRQTLARARRWTVPYEHEDLGTVPLATPGLAKEVFALAPRRGKAAPGDWMVPHPMAAPRAKQDGRAAEGPAAHGPRTGGDAPPTGGNTAFSVRPLRHTTLTALAQQVPEAPDRWREAMRVLDVLHAVRGARAPLPPAGIASAAGLGGVGLGRLLGWLCAHHLLSRLRDGSYTVGPLFSPVPAGDPVLRHDALTRLLDDLRDTTGAAVYYARYTDGEIDIQHCSDGPGTPAITQWVDLKEAAHASANGKSLMAQLDFEGRMDHLARYRPYALTERTITDPAALFRALDGHGPHASQFDVLEYSRREVCVAVPVALEGQPACVALSLPADRSPRLVEAARILSGQSALILLTLLAALPAADAPEQPEGGAAASRHGPSGLLLPTGSLGPSPVGWTGFLTDTHRS